MAGWHHRLDGLSLSELQELVMDREARRAAIHGAEKSRTRLNWTDWISFITYQQFLIIILIIIYWDKILIICICFLADPKIKRSALILQDYFKNQEGPQG